MGFRGLAGAAALVVAAAVGYGAYAPDNIEKWFPAAGGLRARGSRPAAGRDEGASLGAGGRPTSNAQTGSVSVAAAKRVDYPVYIDGLGQAQAYNTVTVRTRVDGQIDKIAFDEGQMVKAGDLLAQIDPRPFQAALDQAKAKQAQDQATLANAKLDLQRYSTLAKQSFATQQQLDTQNALVNQLIAQEAADAAAIDAAQVQLDYTTIAAPIGGRVGFRLVDEGNIVNAAQQTGIVTIAQIAADRRHLHCAAGRPAAHRRGARRGRAAGRSAHLRRREAAGDRQADRHRQPGRRHDRHDPSQGRIRQQGPCACGRAKRWRRACGSSVEKDALTIPDRAVQRGPDGLFVYVVGVEIARSRGR